MHRRAIRTLLLGVVSSALSLSGCASNRRVMELEARVQSDDKVIIGVRPDGSGGKIDMVYPPVKESCRPARTDCAEQVRWKVAGPIGDWKVHVEEKAGGTRGCFRAFDLHKDHTEEVQTPAEPCQREETAWYYDVVLRDAGGRELDKVDPLVLVGWAPGP